MEALKLRQSQIVNLLDEADKLLKLYDQRQVKESRSHQTLDNLSYIKGVKQQADKIMKAKSNLSLKYVKNTFVDFVTRVDSIVPIGNIISKSPTFNINYNKQGMIGLFANDLNVRMISVDIGNYIKDLKRIKTTLLRELRKSERQKEELEIKEKFDKMINKVSQM